MLEELIKSAKETSPFIMPAVYAASAYLTMIPLTSFVEWGIHRFMMHAPKSKRIPYFSKAQSESHNDKHHGAYKAPKHYYQDAWNDNIVSKFSWTEVAKIYAGTMGISFGAAALYNVVRAKITGQPVAVDWTNDAAFMAGVTAAVGTYYGAYETTHDWMHVIGKERYKIHEVFAHAVQNTPDGKLRMPKDVLDNMTNAIETIVDATLKNNAPIEIDSKLVLDVKHYLAHNRRNGVEMNDISSYSLLKNVTHQMAEYERERRAKLTGFSRTTDTLRRKTMGYVRNSDWFKWIDNHHYIHHDVDPDKTNLNVVLPIADLTLGTRKDSSSAALRDESKMQTIWICPYAPTFGKKFSDRYNKADKKELVSTQ